MSEKKLEELAYKKPVEEARKAASKKASAAKLSASKMTKTASSAPKTSAPKASASAKSSAVKTPKFNLIIQDQANRGISCDDIIAKVKAAAGITGANIDIYVKAEEGKAYYVANDKTGSVDLF